MPELRIQLSEEHYGEVQRAAADEHVDPAVYVSRMVAGDLERSRFTAGAGAFIAEHAAGFADHFGSGASAGRTAA